MATLQIKIKNGAFVGTNGVYCNVDEATHVVANGWDCQIDDSTIKCVAIRKYSDGEHEARYSIDNRGFASLSINGKAIKEGFVVPRGEKLNGIIGLSGGNIDTRYGYFRSESFKAFMDEFGLTAISHENPNGTWTGACRYNAKGLSYIKIITNGKTVEEYHSNPYKDYKNSIGAYDGESSYTVTDATWTVVEVYDVYGDNHNHCKKLYTFSKNAAELANALRKAGVKK